MKKVINNYHELIEWCESILLDDDFLCKVSSPQVTYYFSLSSFDIEGVLSGHEFDLSELPPVLKKADVMNFYARNNMLKFHAHFQADGE